MMTADGDLLQSHSRMHFVRLLLVVLLVALASHWRLLVGPGFATDDYPALYVRTVEYWREIRTAGWPRILPDATRGGGNAFPTFYPPLTPTLAALTAGLTGKVVLGVHLVAWLSVALSGVTFLALASGLGLAPVAALAGAIAYVTAPYRFTLLQQRGSLAEAWVYVFIPLVLLGGLHWVRKGRTPEWWPACLAGLLLTHVVLGGWAVLMLAAVTLLTVTRIPPLRQWAEALAALALAVGLAAPYLVPLLAGMGGTRLVEAETVWTDLPTIQAKALTLAELIGLERRSLLMRLEFGPLFLVLPIAVVTTLWSLRRLQRGATPVARLLGASFLGCVAVLLVMMMPGPVLSVLPSQFRMIQFPWRLIVLANLLGALTLGLVVHLAPKRPARYAGGLAVVVLALGGMYYGSEPLRYERFLTDAHVHGYLLDSVASDHGWTSAGEHLPRGTHQEWLGRAVDRAKPGPGNQVLERWTRAGSGYTARVRLSSASVVALPLVAYPLWRVRAADGTVLRTERRIGLLTVPLDAGIHELWIERRLTPADRLGLLIGALSLASYLGWNETRRRRARALTSP